MNLPEINCVAYQAMTEDRYSVLHTSQSKVRSLSYATIPFEVTCANIFSPSTHVTIQLHVSLTSAGLINIIKLCNYI